MEIAPMETGQLYNYNYIMADFFLCLSTVKSENLPFWQIYTSFQVYFEPYSMHVKGRLFFELGMSMAREHPVLCYYLLTKQT